MKKYIMGTYASTTDAKDAVEKLRQQGYPANSISVMADRTMVTDLGDVGVAVEDDMAYTSADENTWGRIKGFFGREEKDHGAVQTHRKDLQSGKILVLVDHSLVPEGLKMRHGQADMAQQQSNMAAQQNMDMSAQQDTTMHNEPHTEMQGAQNTQQMQGNDDETIRLAEEQLHVDKERVESGEVTLKKRVVEETKTIDVPVEHEELVIERKPMSGQMANGESFEDDTITIPLSEEQVHITKEPMLTEEVHVKKHMVSGTKHVSEQVRKEELDVDKNGNITVEDVDPVPTTSGASK